MYLVKIGTSAPEVSVGDQVVNNKRTVAFWHGQAIRRPLGRHSSNCGILAFASWCPPCRQVQARPDRPPPCPQFALSALGRRNAAIAQTLASRHPKVKLQALRVWGFGETEMLQSINWLLEDPIAIYVTVGIAVSIIQHYREMKLIEVRAADLAARIQRLEVLMMTS